MRLVEEISNLVKLNIFVVSLNHIMSLNSTILMTSTELKIWGKCPFGVMSLSCHEKMLNEEMFREMCLPSSGLSII